MKNIPRHNAAILVANQRSTMDAFLIMSILRRKIYTFGKADFFEFFLLGWYLRALGGIPVKNGRYNRASINKAKRILGQNRMLLIFPEGKVHAGSEMLPFKHSFMKLALKHNMPIIPIAITSSDKALKLGHFFPRPADIFVSIMEPVKFRLSYGNDSKKLVNFYTQQVRQTIAIKSDEMKTIHTQEKITNMENNNE